MKYLKKIIKLFKIIFLIIYIVFEEFLWVRIGLPIYERIKEFEIIKKLQNIIESIENKYLVLILFLIIILIDNALTVVLGYASINGLIIFVFLIYFVKALLSILTVLYFKLAKKQLIKFNIIKNGYFIILKIKYSKTMKEIKQFKKFIKNKIGRSKIRNRFYKILKKKVLENEK